LVPASDLLDDATGISGPVEGLEPAVVFLRDFGLVIGIAWEYKRRAGRALPRR
jgi:hypothetical protein